MIELFNGCLTLTCSNLHVSVLKHGSVGERLALSMLNNLMPPDRSAAMAFVIFWPSCLHPRTNSHATLPEEAGLHFPSAFRGATLLISSPRLQRGLFSGRFEAASLSYELKDKATVMQMTSPATNRVFTPKILIPFFSKWVQVEVFSFFQWPNRINTSVFCAEGEV